MLTLSQSFYLLSLCSPTIKSPCLVFRKLELHGVLYMLFNVSTILSVFSPLIDAVAFTFPPAVVNEMEKTLGCLIQQSGTRGAVMVPKAFR